MLVALALLTAAGRTRGEPPTTEAKAGAHDCVPGAAETVAVAGCKTSLTGWLQCDAFPSSGAPSPGTAELVLDCKRASWGNHTIQHCCAKLQGFKRSHRGRCRERLKFRNFTVGWAAYDDSPGFINIVEVHILKNVSNLNPFWYDSSDDRFWDFSSPVFSAPNGSLSLVEFNRPEGKWEKEETMGCEISLDNIYHLGNTSIEHFYLSSNWKNSTNLKLGQMPKLKTFTLSGTSIQHFPQDAHFMMPRVEELTLRNNAVMQPPPGGLSLLASLVSLDLSGTPVGDLSGWLLPLPRLRKLHLRNSGLCCLAEQRDEGAMFRSVPGLEVLDISGNALPALGVALGELHGLRRLDASHNHLLELPQLHILGRASLDFSHNSVRTLPHCSSLAPGNRSLRLDLTGNRLSAWEGTADLLRCVKALNLAHNRLATLSDGMLSSLDSVEEVDLRGNPLDCSGCPLLRLRMWLQETPARVLPEDQALRCASPPLFAGQPLRQVATQPGACDQPVVVVSRPPLVVALVSGLSACVALLLAAAGCYRYRFEIAYSAHLIRLRSRARRRRREARGSGAEHFLFDAFILYSGSDRSWVVGTLVPLLENGAQRYRICLHERDFQLGTVIVQNISSSMDRSRHTIVVLSRSFLSSRWCRWEMDLANHRTLDPSQREFIILLELEPLERSLLPRHLRFLMDTRRYLQWHQADDTHNEEQAFRRLKRALGPSCFTCSDSSRC